MRKFSLSSININKAPRLPKKGEVDNFVIIRVWLPTSIQDAGHVSLETPCHYISLWPTGTITNKSEAKKNVDKHLMKNLEEDIAYEKRRPDTEICLYALDVVQMTYYIERSLLPTIKHWTLSGPSFDGLGKLQETALGADLKEQLFGTSPHSCASIVYKLLQIGGVAQILPRVPVNTKPINNSTARVIIGAPLVTTAALTAGTATFFWKSALSTPKYYFAPLGSALGIHDQPAEKVRKEIIKDILEASTTAVSNTAVTTIGLSALYAGKTNIEHENIIAKYRLEEILENQPSICLRKDECLKAINYFKYPADCLDIHIVTPEDINRIIHIAVLFEVQKYPITSNFPRNYDEKQHINLKNHMFATINKYESWTPLHYAAKENNIEKLESLWNANPALRRIKTGAGRMNGQQSLLHLAAEHGANQCLLFLLQQEELDINEVDQNLMTPLHKAVQHKKNDAFTLLLKYNPDLAAYDNEYFTASHWATRDDTKDMFITLSKLRPDLLKIRCKDNKTVTHLAIERNAIEILKLCHNAEIDSQDSIGNTPLHLAYKLTKTACVDLLNQMGANPNIENKDGKKPHELAPTTVTQYTIQA